MRLGDALVEIKAKAVLDDVDVVQALSYLKASEYRAGLLLNFGSKKLGIKRPANRRAFQCDHSFSASVVQLSRTDGNA